MKMLREVRKAKGFTMKQLGEMVGVSESAISLYETGKREADFETLLKIGEILDCSVDYLLRGKEQKETPTPVSEDGLNEEQQELVNLFDAAPPALRSAALAVLRAAEERGKAPGGTSEAE